MMKKLKMPLLLYHFGNCLLLNMIIRVKWNTPRNTCM